MNKLNTNVQHFHEKQTANHCWRKVDLIDISCWYIGRLHRQYCPNDVLLYSRSLVIQWNLDQIPNYFLGRNWQVFPKFIRKWKGLREGNKLEKWQPFWKTHASWFWNIQQSYNNQDSIVFALDGWKINKIELRISKFIYLWSVGFWPFWQENSLCKKYPFNK